MVVMVGFGYLEDRLGFFKEEINAINKRSPQINQIIRLIKEKDDK